MSNIVFPISEIFLSLQGEGKNTGKPAIFIRFWGCNLKCDWCDSKYSWAPEYIEEKMFMSLENIIKKITSMNCNHIVFTGGEPLLFQKQIKAIQFELGHLAYDFELETNGTKEITEWIAFTQINVSPKLKSSGNEYQELKIFNTDFIGKTNCFPLIDLKYVAGNKEDCNEILENIEYLKKDSNIRSNIDKIYIMPKGTTLESQTKDLGYLIKFCLDNNFILTLRQHILLFGDKKGV